MRTKDSPNHSGSRARQGLKGIIIVFLLIWAGLSLVIFIGMRNYPELPGQKVPKPWMLSLFMLFLVAAGVWAHIFFGVFYHRIRIVVASLLGIQSRAATLDPSLGSLVTSSPDQWEASEGTPFIKVIIFTIMEWIVSIVGIVIPIALLLSTGAILTAYLSEQITAQEIRGWFGL